MGGDKSESSIGQRSGFIQDLSLYRFIAKYKSTPSHTSSKNTSYNNTRVQNHPEADFLLVCVRGAVSNHGRLVWAPGLGRRFSSVQMCVRRSRSKVKIKGKKCVFVTKPDKETCWKRRLETKSHRNNTDAKVRERKKKD